MSHNHYITFLAIGSVLTPYHNEETVYSRNKIDMKNEDGVSILFYLQRIFPGLSYWIIYRYIISLIKHYFFVILNYCFHVGVNNLIKHYFFVRWMEFIQRTFTNWKRCRHMEQHKTYWRSLPLGLFKGPNTL